MRELTGPTAGRPAHAPGEATTEVERLDRRQRAVGDEQRGARGDPGWRLDLAVAAPLRPERAQERPGGAVVLDAAIELVDSLVPSFDSEGLE
jgi:hypothetical protein